MTTLDDKLLGEKTHYYCSSSSDDEDYNDASEGDFDQGKSEPAPKFIPSHDLRDREGSSTNTGPKGVIKDWQRFKQLENERREEQERERLELSKKLALTCQSVNDEEKLRKQNEQIDQELKELLDDKILEEFKQMHMQELVEQHSNKPCYGSVLKIESGQEFLDAIDNAQGITTVIVYIYCDGEKDCKLMYECLQSLSQEYPEVKFCSVEASVAKLSRHFKKSGVPALLVYKGGNLIGNFVRLTDELGGEFVTSDIENYLLEHGMLPDRSLILSSIRKANGGNDDSDDSN